jgi:hypothetical protein
MMGFLSDTTYAKIDNTSASSGQVLKYNGTAWAPAADAGLTSEADGIIGNEVTNATASGGLTRAGSGTAAAPYTLGIADAGVTTARIAANAVTSAKIATGSVTSTQLADNAVNSAKIADGSITSADLNSMGATAGSMMTYGAAGWSGSSFRYMVAKTRDAVTVPANGENHSSLDWIVGSFESINGHAVCVIHSARLNVGLTDVGRAWLWNHSPAPLTVNPGTLVLCLAW